MLKAAQRAARLVCCGARRFSSSWLTPHVGGLALNHHPDIGLDVGLGEGPRAPSLGAVQLLAVLQQAGQAATAAAAAAACRLPAAGRRGVP